MSKSKPKDVRELLGANGPEAVVALANAATPYQPPSDGVAYSNKTEEARVKVRVKLEARRFNVDEPPPKPTPILRLCDKTISTPGNITNIQAPAKAGKSAVVGAIIAAMLTNDEEADTLGFTSRNDERRAVIHFDTEQSRFDHDALIRRAMTRAGVDTIPDWFVSYSLTDLGHDDRLSAWRTAIEDASDRHEGVFLILLDGVADICGDPNNPEEAFALVGDLHALAINLDCAIITVLHENPGSDSGKMRGHLGSQLERKAETPLRLAKEAASGITTIWADRARHCHIPKDQGHCFTWCDDAMMHVSSGSAAEVKEAKKIESFKDEVDCIMNASSLMRNKDLMSAIGDLTGVKETAQENRVKAYVKFKLITKTEDGRYRKLP